MCRTYVAYNAVKLRLIVGGWWCVSGLNIQTCGQPVPDHIWISVVHMPLHRMTIDDVL